MKQFLIALSCFFSLFDFVIGQTKEKDDLIIKRLNDYNVIWDSPSKNSKGSMPLGNGDIGLNVWVEKDGDLMIYLSKTDAWSEEVSSNEGLLKLGKLRLHFSSMPFQSGKIFLQTLKLSNGSIEIKAADKVILVWVDANHPVVHLESQGAVADKLTLSFESLRSKTVSLAKDTLLNYFHGI